MLWLVTGGIGCGKSAFAEELALTVGREGIRLACSSFPGISTVAFYEEKGAHSDFSWTHSQADETLAHKLNAINLESNFFRADRRVIVIDSLSGWLREIYHRTEAAIPDAEARIEADWQEVLSAIFAYQGKMIVVTEDITAGLSLSSRELTYAYRLAAANRLLLEASNTVYRMSAGMATEVKGYRLKRGNLTHENIYPDR
ncbi:bifunctional adenosylcobinamide kinase/adenosylcobinamide-phosphate guanylyltransferase [Cohnella silvisoli]|uniref:Bifunctional adenosylcobinamide kinase/adenosylcobinamide-phosphate guanylyltransferase n=1 Tax=Cohnella silvisoli TaxID=2873699 RepID=A0ABV1KXM5_9BACL|nr:bifunctional adenosylcobinamide kinase/adenosylcobinamide-phosphate guanylyltransferase [Cohnella silvisoli]MCD9024219.1 bifunctional adenosylcobinamide kinase/adenosylcobinamide-phosphate guanylyltransferase [Cohnella silvisoli]